MPFVQRDKAGKIVGAFSHPRPGEAEEWLPEDNVEVAAFRASAGFRHAAKEA